MSLTIKESEGIFLVEGSINSTTAKKFKDHLEFLLAYTKSVTINIDAVTNINNNGLKIIADLFQAAQLYNKTFTVIGYGSKEISNSVDFSTAA